MGMVALVNLASPNAQKPTEMNARQNDLTLILSQEGSTE
jgi:hypothetical protein